MEERQTYDVLRDVGFTHYGTHVMVKRHLYTRRWGRALEKEKAAFIAENVEIIRDLSFQCLIDDPETMTARLTGLIWRDRSEPPAVEYTIVRAVVKNIAEVFDWDKKERQVVTDRIKKYRIYEEKVAQIRWTALNIPTYLRMKGLLSPRNI
jgi:hypothetical protein